MGARAVVFDFNGTLSHDEPVLCEIFTELFAEQGRPLSAQEYFDRLAGLSDPEIVRTWLGRDHPAVDDVIAERIRRYRAAVGDGSTVPEDVRAAVRYAAERVPVGIVSGAARDEIERRTDEAASAPWRALGDAGSIEVAALLRPIATAVAASGVVPFPNPVGLGWPPPD
jgi:beta-phosphoglucomutase-like phosphatase (HAD superfamily)